MASTPTEHRGNWNSKLGFVLAAAGSAIGLGNIWKFPSEVAENGGAAFLLIYVICCFLIGFPVMAAEMSIGRFTKSNPVGAFRILSGKNRFFPLVGAWGVLCGIMILSYYNVIAGWTFSFVFEEVFHFAGMPEWSAYMGDTGNGVKNVISSLFFMLITILVITGGVSGGIERATKTMMPILLGILIMMILYVVTLDGAAEGLRVYLLPDLSKITPPLIFAAMGQSFFSLSLGMGALITYGSYLNKKQNIAESAAYVTLADFGIAFLAGLLIIPAMYVAQNNGVQIYNEAGKLIASDSLVFNVLPQLFHNMSPTSGMIFGTLFFLLLSIAALTSTISLLEVPVSHLIDDWKIKRKHAAWILGSGIAAISAVISFDLSWIGRLDLVFNQIGLPLGGFMICIFLGYYWKVHNAMEEIKQGFDGLEDSFFYKVWPIFIRYICPLLIGAVFTVSVYNLF